MKKLTAGIFAGILGMVSMGAADANVASTGWVNQQLGTKASTETVEALEDLVNVLKGAVYDTDTQQPIDIEDLKAALESDIEALEGKFVDADKNPIDLSALKTGLAKAQEDLGNLEDLIGTGDLPLEAATVIEALNKINNKTASNADFTQLKETVSGNDGNGGLVGEVATLKTNVGTTPVSDQISGALTDYYTKTEVGSAIDAAKLKNAGDATHAFYTDADGNAIKITKVAEAAKADSATNAEHATSADSATNADYAATAGTADTATTAAGYTANGAIATGLAGKVDVPTVDASSSAYGKYVLTADKTAQGTTYYWEQIERAVVDGAEQF